MADSPQDKVSRVERHLGTIAQLLLVGALAWVGSTLIGLREDVAVIKSELPALVQLQHGYADIMSRLATADQDRRDLRERLRELRGHK